MKAGLYIGKRGEKSISRWHVMETNAKRDKTGETDERGGGKI
jgi:hypothetical protein